MGTIRFYPVTGGRPSIGQIQPDGSYELATYVAGDGALPGKYEIAIEAIETISTGQAPKDLAEEIEKGPAKSKIAYLLPPKYATKEFSGLTRMVESGNNEINFDLE
ncbi:MAG: hypothetical protein ABGX16_16810 [Pirellulales bacterium]